MKCRTRRALDIRTHIAVVSPSHNFVCLSVVENENKLQDLLRIDSLIVNSSGHPNLNVYSQYYHRLRAWTILVDLKRRSRCVCVCVLHMQPHKSHCLPMRHIAQSQIDCILCVPGNWYRAFGIARLKL